MTPPVEREVAALRSRVRELEGALARALLTTPTKEVMPNQRDTGPAQDSTGPAPQHSTPAPAAGITTGAGPECQCVTRWSGTERETDREACPVHFDKENP